MPSSHSQNLFFYAAYCIQLMQSNYARHVRVLSQDSARILLTVLVVLAAVGLSGARVVGEGNIHTPAQVVVGMAFGSVFGTGWYVIHERFETYGSDFQRASLVAQMATFASIFLLALLLFSKVGRSISGTAVSRRSP